MADYRTPGVYVEEISIFPPSVAQVETAIPAFIGNTGEAKKMVANDLHLKPTRITSLAEYRLFFGGPGPETFAAAIDAADRVTLSTKPAAPSFYMYYCLQMYFANGGGPCYVVSTGNYTEGVVYEDISNTARPLGLKPGLEVLAKEDEPTLIVFPDAPKLGNDNFHTLYASALAQCATLQDRFLIADIRDGANADYKNNVVDGAEGFRTKIGASDLKYGAAYYPFLETILSFHFDETAVDVTFPSGGGTATAKMNTLLGGANDKFYHLAKSAIEQHPVILPPAALVAGVYARVDRTRGVWKAPANVSLTGVIRPVVQIDRDMNDNLNKDTTGKAVNAIRAFTGKGVLIWGARTLAGNDNEWRYVSVRRFFNMVEESVKKATEQFVFEPNDANTWIKVKAMIENFLILQWRAGALMGAKPNEAFFVKVGLGETMSMDDVLNGRMIVEIGMAVVRPAEFIILRFSHKMLNA